ncbi:MAG: DinB family protein [Chloroflexota bacterium]|jgi:hypothetical protein
MTHPLIDQFRFTRHEWLRALDGVVEEDAKNHFGRMNCISWIVGHLAWHEQRYWLTLAQDIILYPQLNDQFQFGGPISTPSLAEMFEIWSAVATAADPFLDSLTTTSLQADLQRFDALTYQSIGSALRRITYHYWFHMGEILAIRQMLGQSDLPQFVGLIEAEAPYRPESFD